jgi:hypothetical protein
MPQEASMSWASKLVAPYRIDDGEKFRVKDFDPADTGHLRSKAEAKQLLEQGMVSMAELQGSRISGPSSVISRAT